MGDTLLVYRELTALRQDTLVVFLRRHGQYRMLLSQSLLFARVTPLKRAREAFVAAVTPEQFAPRTILELHPYTTGPHLITVTGFASTETVRLWLWADRTEELRAQASRDRLWGIGLQVGIGYHTGYRVLDADPAPPDGSLDVETGLLFGSSGILSGLLGIAHQARYGGTDKMLWVFAEPRVRVVQAGQKRWPLDIDVILRVGRGSSGSETPSLVGAGVFASKALDSRPGARGWRAGLTLMYARLGNAPADSDREFMRGGVTLSWLP
jgi:hypothetical protein